MSLIYLTDNGALRARQRCGWAESALQRMLDRIVAFGASPAKCPPALAQWLEDLAAVCSASGYSLKTDAVFSQ